MAVTRFRCHSGHFSMLFISLIIDIEDFYIHDLFPVSILTRIADKLLIEPLDGSVFSPTLLSLASLGTI